MQALSRCRRSIAVNVAPSGKPVEYLKGIETERGLKEVPEEEIIKGYKHTKAHYVLRRGTLDSVGHGV